MQQHTIGETADQTTITLASKLVSSFFKTKVVKEIVAVEDPRPSGDGNVDATMVYH
jgi:hypothetical protein